MGRGASVTGNVRYREKVAGSRNCRDGVATGSGSCRGVAIALRHRARALYYIVMW